MGWFANLPLPTLIGFPRPGFAPMVPILTTLLTLSNFSSLTVDAVAAKICLPGNFCDPPPEDEVEPSSEGPSSDLKNDGVELP